MVNPEQKKKILNFLSGHPLAVVATADLKGNPAAAVVLFAETDDLEIIFGTHQTRKYQNLQVNPKVALVMTKGMVSVQYHGQAAELAGQALEEYVKAFASKHPKADKHLSQGTKFLLVRPTWIRYIDMSKSPTETFEIKLSADDWH